MVELGFKPKIQVEACTLNPSAWQTPFPSSSQLPPSLYTARNMASNLREGYSDPPRWAIKKLFWITPGRTTIGSKQNYCQQSLLRHPL